MDRDFLRKLALTRIEEAEVLLRNKKWSGAYYLTGYSIECALKACIAKRTREYDFPDKDKVNESYTHKLKTLMKVAELDKEFKDETDQNPDLRANWAVVTQWSEQTRYKNHTENFAKDFYSAVTSANNGVLIWIAQHW